MELTFDERLELDKKQFLGKHDRDPDEEEISHGADDALAISILYHNLLKSRTKRDIRSETRSSIDRSFVRQNITDQEKDKAIEIMDNLKPDFWDKYATASPDRIADKILDFARERLQREKKKKEKEQSQTLSVAADDQIKNVINKLNFYLDHPSERQKMVRGAPPVRQKEWSELSDNSLSVYRRTLIKIRRETEQYRSDMDYISYLSNICRTKSRSNYDQHRACLLQIANSQNKNLARMIKSMPPYKELCTLLGREPTPRVGEYTRARRRQKDIEILRKLKEELSEKDNMIVSLLDSTGCRLGELPSIRLDRDDTSITIKIETNKTGCRIIKAAPPTREIKYNRDDDRYQILSNILDNYGNTPAKDINVKSFQSRFNRVRQKIGATEQTYCIHSFRHNFARREKNRINKSMAEEYGSDWRRSLYGVNWRDNPDYYRVYSDLCDKMGHSNYKKTQIYG